MYCYLGFRMSPIDECFRTSFVMFMFYLLLLVGDIPCENSLLRQVSSLLRRLPAIESEKFQDDFLMVSAFCSIWLWTINVVLYFQIQISTRLLCLEFILPLGAAYMSSLMTCMMLVLYNFKLSLWKLAGEDLTLIYKWGLSFKSPSENWLFDVYLHWYR